MGASGGRVGRARQLGGEGLSFSPLQLGPQHFEIAARRRPNEPQRLVGAPNHDLIVSLKQNHRDLYQSAVGLFAHRPADSVGTEQHDGKTYQFQIWDTDGLPFSIEHPQPVRVVRSEEKLTQNHYRRRELVAETTDHEWLWYTTLRDAKAFPAELVRYLSNPAPPSAA